jgi:hypothetical protein
MHYVDMVSCCYSPLSLVVLLAFLLKTVACKRLDGDIRPHQFTHNMLSSKTHQSFPMVFNFSRFFWIFAVFYQFFAVAVIVHASRDSVDRKTGLTMGMTW